MLTTSAVEPGRVHLTFGHHAGQTVVTRAYAASPAKLIAARPRGPASWVYAANFGGGLVGGDDIRIDVEVLPGATALLTTQASTKVYRSAKRTSQSVSASVGEGGLLVILPDPVVCFASADFRQTQHFDLAPTAGLVMVDWVTSGRHACGERWAFSRYESRIEMRRDGRRVLFDGVVLEPEVDTPAERLGKSNVLLTALITGRRLEAGARHILEVVRSAAAIGPPEPFFVCSAVPIGSDGTLVRMTGACLEQVGRALRTHLSFLVPLLGDDPWSRKW